MNQEKIDYQLYQCIPDNCPNCNHEVWMPIKNAKYCCPRCGKITEIPKWEREEWKKFICKEVKKDFRSWCIMSIAIISFWSIVLLLLLRYATQNLREPYITTSRYCFMAIWIYTAFKVGRNLMKEYDDINDKIQMVKSIDTGKES